MPISAIELLTGKKDEIRDHVTMTGRFPFRPTLFVGLGGTGSQAVAKEKELFLELVRPQMQAGVEARLADINPLYAFRAFDTNGGEQQPPLEPGVEWHQLAAGDLEEFYEHKGKTEFFEPWLVKRFPLRTLGAGCGGFRNLGRLAVISNISQVNQILIQAKDQITAAAAGLNVVSTKPLIHVFCSLSGGTGSGMLLDFCFLLRHLLPGVEIIGHIAVLDGLPGVTGFQRRTIAANTFCALKELNAFMSGKAPMGEIVRYSQSVQARTCEPMNYCFLISSYRDDGSASLPRQEHLSSFMARVAFLISGYSFVPTGNDRTPDFAGVMANVPRLAEVEGGAAACYLVPGFAQAHFPVSDTALLFSATKARECLQYLRGGAAKQGDEEAAQFFTVHQFDSAKILDSVRRVPGAEDDARLSSPTYNQLLEQLFEAPADNREQILGLADSVTSKRLATVTATLHPNLEAMLSASLKAVRETAASMLEDSRFLGLGTLDFLADLKKLVNTEYVKTKTAADAATEPDYADLPRRWNTIRDQVVDAVTSEGAIDRLRDWYNRQDTRNVYIEFLNHAEVVLLEKACADLAKDFYHSLADEITKFETAVSRLVTSDLETAIQHLHKAEQRLATALARQDNAEDGSVLHIRSFNVMTEEWRKSYLKDRKQLPPEDVIGNLARGGWRPIHLLDVPPGENGIVGEAIALDVIQRIEPFFAAERKWTPVEVLQQTAQAARQKPADLIAKVYAGMLQPQMQISGVKSRTNIDLDTLVFAGGIDKAFSDELQTSGKFQNVTFNSAENQEVHRINFTTVTLPVPLAGCNLVTDKLAPHYELWLEDAMREAADVREQKVALHHCFPGSSLWPSPVAYATGFDETKSVFAKALAISEILEPTLEDQEKMNTQKGGPKEKRYALFQVGDSQYWLWPFFPPEDASAPIPGVPCNLGKNVVAAFQAFCKNPPLIKGAAAWVEWMEEHWSDHHNSKEMRNLVSKALLSFATRKGRSSDLACVAFWDEIAQIVSGWQIG